MLSRGGPVNSVAFSPDGTLLATASSNGTVRVSDTRTGARRGRIDVGSPVMTAIFSHDGALIAMAGGTPGRGVVQVQRLADRKVLLMRGDRELVECVAFSHDDALVVVAGKSGAVRVFEVSTAAEWTGVEHDGPVTSVDFSPRARTAASAATDGTARTFAPAPGPERYRVPHNAPVSHIEFVPGLNRLLSASAYGTVVLTDAATGDLVQWIGHGSVVHAVLVSAAGNFVATARGGLRRPGL